MINEILDRSKAPDVYEMRDLSLPVPEAETLDNGIVFHHLRGGSQEVLQLSITWQGGCVEARIPSIARLTASLMSEGTRFHTGTEISEILDFHGAMLRIVAEPHTTTLSVTTLSHMANDILPIVDDVICNPVFEEQKFVTFKDMEVQNFILSHSKVSTLSSDALERLIKGSDHPGAKNQTVEDIQKLTADDIRDFYARMVTTDKCQVYLSGNFSDDTFDKIKNMLAALPRRCDAMEMVIEPFRPEEPQTVVINKADAVQAAVNIGIPTPGRSHPDYVPLRFATIALGGYFGSRLMKNIREDKGYTYGIASYLLGSRGGSYIAISAQTDKTYVDEVIREVKHEIDTLAAVPMCDDELMRLRQHISSSLMEILDSPFAIMDHYKVIKTVGLPDGYFENQVECVRTMTAEMIMKMARKYMLVDQMRISICN